MPKIIPKSYFRTKEIVSAGDRDRLGRFVKPHVKLKACQKEDAEFAVGIIVLSDVFVLAKLPPKEVLYV